MKKVKEDNSIEKLPGVPIPELYSNTAALE
jgi:hypothetical protein